MYFGLKQRDRVFDLQNPARAEMDIRPRDG